MAELSSKELVRGLFQMRDLPRVPFIPWVGSFAAQLEQIEIEDMLSDAGLLSTSLMNAQKLFGYDAIVNIFDPSLEAEACGCGIDWETNGGLPKVISHPLSQGATIDDLDISNLEKQGRIPVVLEATKRLNLIKGKQVAIVGVITGPLTLAKHLNGETFVTGFNEGSDEATKLITLAGNIGLKLCRKYCEIGIDVIVVADEMIGQLRPGQFPALISPLRSIWNVARFFNVHSLVLTRGCKPEHIEPILGLQADGVALSGNIDYARLRDEALKRKCCYSSSLPTPLFLHTTASEPMDRREWLSAKSRGLFLSTEWDVPYEADVDAMHEVMAVIRND